MPSNYNNIYVGMRGAFTAVAPFNTLFNAQSSYTCIAIEDITGLIARGKNPYYDLYFLNGLTKAQFDNDDALDIPIYTLQSNRGEIVIIPGIYIAGMPDVNGNKYSNVLLGISLSAIPDSLNLTSIKTEMSDLVFSRIGVRSEVKSIVFGTPSVITSTEHLAVEAARVANISKVQSNLSMVQSLTIQNTALLSKIAILENYIKLKIPPTI